MNELDAIRQYCMTRCNHTDNCDGCALAPFRMGIVQDGYEIDTDDAEND